MEPRLCTRSRRKRKLLVRRTDFLSPRRLEKVIDEREDMSTFRKPNLIKGFTLLSSQGAVCSIISVTLKPTKNE